MEDIVLVIDDDSSNLMLARAILGDTYRIAAAKSGASALEYLKTNTPDIILTDVSMPVMDGFETVRRIKAQERFEHTPIMFLTAEGTHEMEARCFEEGAVDFIEKPFVPDILFSRVSKTLELEHYRKNLEKMLDEQAEVIRERTEKLSFVQTHIIEGLAGMIETRGGEEEHHVANLKTYTTLLAEDLRRRKLFGDVIDDEFIRSMGIGVQLHDIGTITVPDNILRKQGKFTEEEFATMKNHTSASVPIVRKLMEGVESSASVDIICSVTKSHHERWDGSGYPEGLKGEDIPLAARITTVCDAFDAVYGDRIYKNGLKNVDKAMEIIKSGIGSQFDPVVAGVFIDLKHLIKHYNNEI